MDLQRKPLRGWLAITLITFFITSVAATHAGIDSRYTFEIASQRVSSALLAFSQQSDIQVIAASKDLGDTNSSGVSGEHTARRALGLILTGTGLSFRVVTDDAVAIEPRSEKNQNGNDVESSANSQSLIVQTQSAVAETSSQTTGKISGTVTDDTGAVMPNVTITIRNEATQQINQTVTDVNGFFAFTTLPSATYTLTAVFSGFATFEMKSIVLNSGDEKTIPVRLEIAPLGEEVVVTGTHIRGLKSPGSSVVTMDREYIDRSGYASVPDIVRTLPQDFAGGVNEILGTTDFGVANINYGSAVNLRGLGASATLVLINGHRIVSGGFAGAFVDVANIPTSAIERIEVLTDGASAIYGSDAVAGVVNIILREDYDGSETRMILGTLDGDASQIQPAQLFGTHWNGGNVLIGYQYYQRDDLLLTDRSYSADTDQRPNGGDNFSSFFSNPGNIINPLTGELEYAIPPGQDGSTLTVRDLLPGVTNFQNLAVQNDLLPKQQMNSVFLNLSQNVGERTHLFAEGRYNLRHVTSAAGGTGLLLFVPDTNPFLVDPYGFGFALVGYNFMDDLGASASEGESENYGILLGGTINLNSAWQLTLTGSYSEEKDRNETTGINFTALDAALADSNPATAFNPFGDGSHTNPATLASIKTTSRSDAVNDISNGDVIVEGPLFAAPGGPARLAVGASYRREQFDSRTQEVGIPDTVRGRDRDVSAAFAEFAVPLIGDTNAISGIQGLGVSIAGRLDDYSDFGTTFNPKLGVAWNPIQLLRVRGSWGTSFKAPRLIELDERPDTNSAVLLPAADPQSASGTSFALFIFGNNADLQEETATNWTAGFDLTSPALHGFNFSLTYYDIDYKDRVVRPGPFQLLTILTQEDQWSSVIQRNPSQAEVDAICNSAIYRGTPCNFLPLPAAIVDVRLRNLAATQTNGLDLSIGQTFDSSHVVFNVGFDGTYVLNFKTAASDTSPFIDIVDTLFNPAAFRLRGTVYWNVNRWGANAAINYTDSYNDETSQPNRTIDSWTTVDLQLSYLISQEGWLNNLEIALNAVNVFDADPPFTNTPTGFDATNANAYGRLISLQAILGW